MNKLYSRLHNVISNFKKRFLSISLLLCSTLYLGTHADAQCIPPPPVTVSPAASCGGDPSGSGPCDLLTASGADTYVWSPVAGLYLNCTHTVPYTGGNTAIVYAAPIVNTVYTVTGTVTATGCTSTATAQVNYTPPAPVVIPAPVFLCLGDPPVKLKIASAPATAQFCSGPVNIPVPDNDPAGASNSINVSGISPSCIVTGMSVTINMPHTRIGNMVFVLKAPNGQIMNLDYYITGTGGIGTTTGFVNSVISSNGTAALSAGVNPYTGTFRPDLWNTPGPFGPAGPTGMQPTATSWAQLFTMPNGSWTLGFYDGVTGDVGTLTSWCLGITYSCGVPASPGIWSPAAGLFFDPAATTPYIAGTAIDSVWARPSPAGVYTYQVTVQGLPAPPVSFTNPVAITIPVGGAATAYPSNVPVFGLPVSGVSVRSIVLNNVSHTRSEDIDVVLQSPSGQTVILMSDVGATNAVNATYTFMDQGPAMSVPAANPTGTYKPTNNGTPDNFPAPGPGAVSQASPAVSMFTGNMNGTWKLFVFDDDGTGDQGVISGGYTINFDTGIPPCTSPPRSVVITVGSQISITTQPVNQNICLGQSAVFSVAAAGSTGLTYQWQVSSNGGATFNNIANAAPYSGVNTATLTIVSPPLSMSGLWYRVIINGTSACAPATSGIAILKVNPLPVIVISANPLIITTPGMTTTIHSTVSPNPAATYTWFYNGSVVAGATVDSLVVDLSGLGDYQLGVTDINGCSGLSNIISISDHFALTIYVYPNPSSGRFQARYHSEPNTTSQRTLVVYNNMGHRVVTKSFTQNISYQRVDLDLRKYGRGLYWIELVDVNGKRLAMSRALVQ